MKFGVYTPGLILYPMIMAPWEADATPEDILRVARRADDLGYDLLSVPEHIVIPQEMSEVMGPRYPEALTAAAFLAGATKQINVLTYVLVLPYRNPVFLAKSIATLDSLSGGRVILGTAAGHMQREFEILNVPYRERGRITNEYLAAMIELWTSDHPSFSGRYVKFENVVFEPKPARKPHPPIWIGGNSEAAMKRVAAYGDGWIPFLISRKQIPGCLDFIRQQRAFQDRPRDLEIVVPLATFNMEDYSHRELGKTVAPKGKEETIDEIGRHRDAGVTGVLANMPRTRNVDACLEWLDWFAAEIMPAFRG